MEYTDDTFECVWPFTGLDGEEYVVVRNLQTETYFLYKSSDITEVAYTNHVVFKNHTTLTGKFFDFQRHFYAIVEKNVLHCDTAAAALVPCGLDVFRPKDDVRHYIIRGKIMSMHSWLTWVKDTPSWTNVMANILGKKDDE